MTAWPTSLPQCPTLNLSERQQLNVLTFQPDVGPPKVRRKSSFVGVDTQMVFRMNVADLATFNSFYINTLQDGASSFTWKHPYNGSTYNWWFDAKSPPLIERITNDTFRVSFPLLRISTGLPSNAAIGSARGIGDANAKSAATVASRGSASGAGGGLGRTTTGITFDTTAVTFDSITHTWDEQ